MHGQAVHISQTHYRRRDDRPFTLAERERVTLLYGGLTERHGVLLGAAFGALGYRVRAYCGENPQYRRPLCAVICDARRVKHTEPAAFNLGSEASVVVGRAARFVTYRAAHLSDRARSEEARVWQRAMEARG